MEDCPSLYMMDSVEERNKRYFKGKQNNLKNFKMNCMALYYFWYEQKVLGQIEDIFDVLDYL